MSILSHTALAFSMSADAFAASLGKGVALNKPRISQALRIGFIFGTVETIAPILGWCAGLAASGFIASIDHWVAFTILLLVGGHMIWESLQRDEPQRKDSHRLGVLVLTAIGTSIDAMAVGATLAFIDANIWLISAMIGCATFMMASIGIMAGHYIGTRAGKIAEALGGVCLIAIGTKILLQHLGILAV